MPEFSVDFSRRIGTIKPMHGVNNGPKTQVFSLNTSALFKDAGIPFARLHDTEYPYGSGHFVDIPCIFPDFNADPADPTAYDFSLTDAYIQAIIETGAKVFYRLGVSIEHAPRKYHIHPPEDFQKWARICEGIVAHYNEGFADGYQYGIEYWEIWNEPENPPMWTGSAAQYYELYSITARHLKTCFPTIKVGGYASSGFYAVTNPNVKQLHKQFVVFFEDFLAHLTSAAGAAPLDFFSWHIYTNEPNLPVLHAEYVDSMLRKYGFTTTENILNEWNYRSFSAMRTQEGAAFDAAVMCAMQKSPCDMLMYYDAQPFMRWCGLFTFPELAPTPALFAFKAFNELYHLGDEVFSTGEDLYTCAAKGAEGDGACMVVNFSAEPASVKGIIKGAETKPVEVFLIDPQHKLTSAGRRDPEPDGTFALELQAYGIALLRV